MILLIIIMFHKIFSWYINVFLNKYTESGSQTVYSKIFLGIGIQPTIALQKQKKKTIYERFLK